MSVQRVGKKQPKSHIVEAARDKKKGMLKPALEEEINTLKDRVSKLEHRLLEIEDKADNKKVSTTKGKVLEINYEVHAAFEIGLQIRAMMLELLGLVKFVKSDSKPENISIYLVEYYRTNNPERYKEIEAMIKEGVFNVVPKGVRYYINDELKTVT